MRILAVGDTDDPGLGVDRLRAIDAAAVVSCGNVAFEALDYLASAANVPLLFVPGDGDPSLAEPATRNVLDYDQTWGDPPGPRGAVALDGRVVVAAGLRFAGLGGGRARGHHGYGPRRMGLRAAKLAVRTRLGGMAGRRRLDVLVTHAPPRPGDGFGAVAELAMALRPRVLVHGGGGEDGHLGTVPARAVRGYRIIDL